jgi:hypothetical protein
MNRPYIPLPDLPIFSLTEDEIALALETAIFKDLQWDVAIKAEKLPASPDSRDRMNRLLAQGVAVWKAQGTMPFAALTKLLLLKFFLGELSGARQYVIHHSDSSGQRDQDPTPSDDVFDDSDEGGFLNLEGIDTSDEIDGDYDFGGR